MQQQKISSLGFGFVPQAGAAASASNGTATAPPAPAPAPAPASAPKKKGDHPIQTMLRSLTAGHKLPNVDKTGVPFTTPPEGMIQTLLTDDVLRVNFCNTVPICCQTAIGISLHASFVGLGIPNLSRKIMQLVAALSLLTDVQQLTIYGDNLS